MGDPRLIRLVYVVIGIGAAVAASVWLRGTEVYGLVMAASGALLGNSAPGPGQVDVKALQELERAKSDPPRP